MKTRHLILGFLLFSAMTSVAEVSNVNLIIRHTDDKLTTFKLDELPIIKPSTEDLVIDTQTGNFSCTLSMIKQIYYENVTEGIDNVTIDGISISQKNNLIVINGLGKSKTVAVYSIDGKLLLTDTATGVDATCLSIENLPNGVYVIKADYTTFKTLKQ